MSGSESPKFVRRVEELFSTPPYVSDPRRAMMRSHLLNGRSASIQRISQILPYLPKPTKEMRVLDAGCGSGMASAAFSQLGFRKIVAFDLGEERIGLPIAPLRHYDDEATVSFLQANGYHIPIADNSIDLCWCSFVIEHVRDIDRILGELFRVLAPNGLLYVSTNNRLWPIEPHSGLWFASWMPNRWAERYARWRKHWPVGEEWDVYLPTYWYVKSTAKAAGFSIKLGTSALVGQAAGRVVRRVGFLRLFEALLPNIYFLLNKPA